MPVLSAISMYNVVKIKQLLSQCCWPLKLLSSTGWVDRFKPGCPPGCPGVSHFHTAHPLSLDTRRSGSDDCGRVNGEVNVCVFITYRLENFYSVCAWQTIVVYV